MGLPGLTSSQMVEVDRIMMVELEVPVDLMMEHAGNNLARLCVTLSPTRDGIFRVIAGSGNNGGGGLGPFLGRVSLGRLPFGRCPGRLPSRFKMSLTSWMFSET